MLIGIPGSGKSTLVAQLSRGNANLQNISSDDLRVEMNLPYDKFNNHIIFEEMHRRLEAALIRGFDVVLDATNLEAQYREYPIRIARSCGASVIAKVVNTDYEVCVKRNSGRNKKAKIPIETLHAMQIKFERTIQSLVGFDEVDYSAPLPTGKKLLSGKPKSNVIPFAPRKPKS